MAQDDKLMGECLMTESDDTCPYTEGILPGAVEAYFLGAEHQLTKAIPIIKRAEREGIISGAIDTCQTVYTRPDGTPYRLLIIAVDGDEYQSIRRGITNG